ncbi:hypothetical protein N7492_001987 [Penicillium capsulatum]|uniref:Uncharacterized protein n=1 Tax=Penicillium capsulatum TaxID=69766 RepID=A0A9W9LVX8_9EURO|nr:hypothetical protein N7492_001987 [Penicillium capsulatum]
MVRKAIQLAPNIQHVRLQFCRPLTRALRARQSQLGSSNSRTDHVSFPESSAQKAALLTFCAQSGVNFEWRTWTEAIDASRLRSLNLGRVRKIEYFDPLIDSITLPSLEKLALRLEMAWDHDAQRKVKTFMGGLRPLNTLRLHGMMDSSLVDSIIERHGSALRNLLMDPYCFNSDARPWSLTATIIGQLSVKCPRLRELGLTVPRFKGNHDEITCYQALGSFHFLEKLCLNLDCSISEPGFFGREQWSAFDLMEYSSITTSAIQICNGDIRDILINAAVDKDLVRSIWENILSYQKRPTSLRWMMISPRRSGYISSVRPAGIGHKVEHMSRSFELTKTGKTAIDVIEIGQARRERQDSEWREIEEQALREMGQRIDSDLEDIMRTIWPFREGIDDWRLFWSSFPLSQ